MPTGFQQLDYYLTTIPSRKVDFEQTDDGGVVLLRPRKLGGAFGKLLGPRLPARFDRIRLDDIGAAIWTLIDGSTSVREIARAVEARLGETLEERDHRVSLFVSTMHRNGMITLMGKTTPEGG